VEWNGIEQNRIVEGTYKDHQSQRISIITFNSENISYGAQVSIRN